MKNINSKSFKQYSNSNKRSISPLLSSHQQQQQPPPTQSSSSNPKSAKKKLITNSPYQKAMKQFDTYGKAQKKRTINYIQQDQRQRHQHNKFRIVTQPVDDRIMHLAQSNIFNSSLAVRQNRKMDTQVAQSSAQLRLNLRQQSNSRSRDRMYSNNNANRNIQIDDSASKSGQRENRSKSRELHVSQKCKNCAKITQQFQYLNAQIKKIIKTKQLWKCGEVTFQQVKQIFSNHKQLGGYSDFKNKGQHQTLGKQSDRQQKSSIHNHNSLQNPNKGNNQIQSRKSINQNHNHNNNNNNIYKFADSISNTIKLSLVDLIAEIQSLTFIDYPKMLQMQIFKYEPSFNNFIDVQETQLKELFAQLRSTTQGKVVEYDTYDTESENNYVKMIVRNLKSRLSACLRENLELRVCKAIYEKSQEISDESEEYLRKVIEEVLENYAERPSEKQKEKNKEKEKEKNKQKDRVKQKGKIVKN